MSAPGKLTPLQLLVERRRLAAEEAKGTKVYVDSHGVLVQKLPGEEPRPYDPATAEWPSGY